MEIEKSKYPVLGTKVDPLFASVIRAQADRRGQSVSMLLKRLLERTYRKQLQAARANGNAP